MKPQVSLSTRTVSFEMSL